MKSSEFRASQAKVELQAHMKLPDSFHRARTG